MDMSAPAKKDIIDIHIHFGAPASPDGGCWWSERFTRTFAYFAMRAVTGTLLKKIDYGRVKTHLFKKLRRSKLVDKAVFLALIRRHNNGKTSNRLYYK